MILIYIYCSVRRCKQIVCGGSNHIYIVPFYLQYMGDIPGGKQQNNTDLIFKPALQHALLRDELYCQIMKQLTDNPGNYSEERGWDLLYLASGVTYPSTMVMKELQEFLRTRTHTLAAESLKRVKRTLSNGQRKHPPYVIEVEGIQKRFMHIYHKVRCRIQKLIFLTD